MTSEPVFVGLWLIAFVLGVRGSIHLVGHYRASAPLLPRSGRRVLLAFALIAVALTAAAGYVGVLAVRRLLGYEPVDWSPQVSALVATGILFIPAALDLLVERIAVEGE